MLRLTPGCRRRSEYGGSGGRAACHQHISRSRQNLHQGATFRSPNVRRSPSCARRVTGVRAIARQLDRPPCTISRELRRNAATRSGALDYRATTAQWHADRSARRPKPAKLAINPILRDYVQDRLAGMIAAPDGAPLVGPKVVWKGRRAVHRQNRRWATAWSPEQIARRLRFDFPEDETMRISHEAIYQALYRARSRSFAPRTDGLLAHRAGAADAEGAHAQARQDLHLSRDHDQSTSGGGSRSSRAGPLGRGPHPGSWKFRDRHLGGAHDTFHPAAAPAAHDGPWPRSSREERTRTRRTWCRGGARRHHAHDHHLA